MTGSTNSNFAVLVLILTIITMPILGYTFVVLNPLTPIFNKLFNETYQHRYNENLPSSTWVALLSVTTSAVTIGSVFGTMSAGRLLMLMTRKRVLQVSHIILLIGILIVALIGKITESYEAIIIGRIVSGFAVGVGYITVPIIIAETCTQERQSFWQCASNSAILFGIALGVVFTHAKILGTQQLWPVAISLTAIPSIIYLMASFRLPNTPFYIARQGDKDKTIALLKKLRIGSQEELENDYELIKQEMKGTKLIGLHEVFNTKQYRMQFINVFCLFVNVQLCGSGCILLYSDRIFRQAGIQSEQATNVTIGLFTGQFVVAIFGPKLLDLFGGRKVLLISNAMEILSLVIFTISRATNHLAPNAMPFVSVTAMALYLLFFAGGVSGATLAMATGITIEPTRATIMGMVIVVFWILSWFTIFIHPYLETALGAYAFTIWIGCTIIFLVYFIIFLPETKGKSVEEIQARLLRKKSISYASSTKI